MVSEILHWSSGHLGQLLTSVGVIADMVGAILVSTEVVRQFRGRKYEEMQAIVLEPLAAGEVKETPEYKRWESLKYRNMRCGLGSLIGGFLFQLVGTWVR